jgi:hypothetical protein
MMKYPLTPIVFFAAFFGGAKADAGPYIGSSWILHRQSPSQCVAIARNILVSLGYNIEFSTTSVIFGETDEKTVLVNCQIPRYAILEMSSIKAPTLPDSDLETLRSNLEQALADVSPARVQKPHARYIQKPPAAPATAPSAAPTPPTSSPPPPS